MRKIFKLTLMTAIVAALLVSPALAKKTPVERTVVDGITLAEVKQHTQLTPFYPATARVTNPSAEVVLALRVDENGKVEAVDVLSSSVEGLGFDVSAADAARQWRFLPAIKDGAPISSVNMVRLTFAPPTLRAPEGFVFTESSRRYFAANLFENPGSRNEKLGVVIADPFGDNTTAVDPQDRIQKSDLPPCGPNRSGDGCMYDRHSMVQFGGVPSTDFTPVAGVK